MKVLLIGCGRMGSNTSESLKLQLPLGWLPLDHLSAIQSENEFELIGICDSNIEMLCTIANRFNIKILYTSYKDAIKETKPDIISIATRTPGRNEIINYAIANGVKGIHTEKPICNSILQTKAIIEFAKEKAVKLSYGTYRRYHFLYKQIKELISNGEIGKVIEIQVHHGKSSTLWSQPHAADLIVFFANTVEIEYIQGSCEDSKQCINNVLDGDPIINFGFIKFKNGINGLITSSDGYDTIISGESGKIIIRADGSEAFLYKKTPDSYLMKINKVFSGKEEALSGTQQAFKELILDIKGLNNNNINLNEIFASQQILFGLVQSHLSEGKKVFVSEIKPDLFITGRTGLNFA
jgi:predicted dehydrogenase